MARRVVSWPPNLPAPTARAPAGLFTQGFLAPEVAALVPERLELAAEGAEIDRASHDEPVAVPQQVVCVSEAGSEWQVSGHGLPQATQYGLSWPSSASITWMTRSSRPAPDSGRARCSSSANVLPARSGEPLIPTISICNHLEDRGQVMILFSAAAISTLR